MQETPYEKMIPVALLLLDTQNPRLPEIQQSQHDAIKSMLRVQGDRVLFMAQHLVENGPSRTNLLIVVPSEDEDEPDAFSVLDGNRRVTALKLLESPSLGEGILGSSGLTKIRKLSAQFDGDPITELRCVVYADREEADPWIELIHRGAAGGAGLVEWDGQVAARFDARKGHKSIALQVLDYVKEKSRLSEGTRQLISDGKFPITTLDRLIGTPYVRKKLGIDRENGQVETQYPEEEVLKGLTRMVEDLGSGTWTVSRLKNQDQRIDYINGFDKSDLPDGGKVLPQVYNLGEEPKAPTGGNGTSGGTRRAGQTRNRSSLIPRDCKLNIAHHRLHKIYTELKKLNLDEFPNAGAVMFRVFVELSLDSYLTDKNVWPEQQISNSKLAQKLNGVATHLENTGAMTVDELAPVRRAAGGQTLLAASISTMHGYVHNRHFAPIPTDIKIAWDELQLFMEKVWA
jgi:hypothetical protein